MPPNFTGISLREVTPPPKTNLTGFRTEAQLEHNNIGENLNKKQKKHQKFVINSLKFKNSKFSQHFLKLFYFISN